MSDDLTGMTHQCSGRADFSSAIGSFAVGVLGNLWGTCELSGAWGERIRLIIR